MIQLEFIAQDQAEVLKSEVQKLRESNEKVRKGLYAKHGSLEKILFDLSSRLNILEENICKGIYEPMRKTM